MKKNYETLEMEIKYLNLQDVITTSVGRWDNWYDENEAPDWWF